MVRFRLQGGEERGEQRREEDNRLGTTERIVFSPPSEKHSAAKQTTVNPAVARQNQETLWWFLVGSVGCHCLNVLQGNYLVEEYVIRRVAESFLPYIYVVWPLFNQLVFTLTKRSDCWKHGVRVKGENVSTYMGL